MAQKYVLTRIEEESDIYVHVKLYRWNMNGLNWETIYTYNILDKKVKEVIEEYKKEEPTMLFYMYECFDEKGGVQGIIYTSHIYLFD